MSERKPGRAAGGSHRTKPRVSLTPAVKEKKNIKQVIDLEEAMEDAEQWKPKRKKF